jgi:bacterioferritin
MEQNIIMKGNTVVIEALNQVLAQELTAINQYFLHARMMENWGLEKIGKLEYSASIDEMKHADQIIKRILFLEGLPNIQRLEKVHIGQTVREIFECDINLEINAIKRLKKNIELAEKEKDYVSSELFKEILASEESHIDWLETQLELLDRVGEQNYQQQQMIME